MFRVSSFSLSSEQGTLINRFRGTVPKKSRHLLRDFFFINSRHCVFNLEEGGIIIEEKSDSSSAYHRNFDYDDCEFEVSGISYYYIIPAGKLKEQQIEFKNEVDDDELLLVFFFKDGSYKVFSLVRYNMSFLY